jgi:hypothetical protein
LEIEYEGFLPPALTLVFFPYSSILKMEAACSSETLVDFKQTTRRSNPGGKTLENMRRSEIVAVDDETLRMKKVKLSLFLIN